MRKLSTACYPLVTGTACRAPACREIVHVHSGAVHVSRTRGCECEGEIVYEYVNVYEYDYAITHQPHSRRAQQINPSRRSRLPGSAHCPDCPSFFGKGYLIRNAWSCMGSESISKDRVEPVVLKGISLPVTRSRIFMPGFAGRFITSFFPV
jgi:hypothetical protein